MTAPDADDGRTVATRQERPRPLTGVEERIVLTALEGLVFPATRYDVLAWATDRGDVDVAILTALDELPDRTFSGPADAMISIPDSRPLNIAARP